MKTLLFALLVNITSPSVPIDPGIYETQCHGKTLRVLVIDGTGQWVYGPLKELIKDKDVLEFIKGVQELTPRRIKTEVCDGEFV